MLPAGFDKSPRSADDFSAVIGGPNWSMELSQKEYADFVKVMQLLAGHAL